MRTVNISVIAFMCVFLIAGSATAKGWGEIREAVSDLNVRDGRTPQNNHRITLVKGQRVKVDFEKNGWVAVFDLDETVRDERRAAGYANVKYLRLVAEDPDGFQQKSGETQKTVAKVAGGGAKAKGGVAVPLSKDSSTVATGAKGTPVQITSDRMVYDESGKIVSFVGHVVAKHGQLALWADSLSAYLTSGAKKKGSSVSIGRIIAQGNVRIKKETMRGACGKLTYHVVSQVIRMEEHPMLKEGENSLTGDVITFDVRSNRSEVVGGQGKPVQAVFMAPKNIKVP